MLVAAGAATGLVVGLTGVGGGALMTPILLLVFGVAPASAIGTDLWFAAVTKVAATRVHHHRRLIDWQIARRLWMGSLSGSAITMGMVLAWPGNAPAAGTLERWVGVAVCVTAVAMVFHTRLQKVGEGWANRASGRLERYQPALTVGAGAILGVVVTLTSVGAGALGAAMLLYLYPLRLTMPRLIATDTVHAIPLALFAGAGHFVAGNVDLPLLANLLAGSIPAVIVGAMLSSRLPHLFLRLLLAVVLLGIGLKLVS